MAINIVDVNGAQLDDEAASVLREAPGAEGPAPREESAQSAEQPRSGSWDDVTPGLVTLLTFVVFPQWQISAEEQQHVSKATADVLEQLFPGGLHDARWAPWFRLALVTSGVALARFDPTYGFPPLWPRKEKQVGPDTHQQPGDAKQAA